MDFFILNLLLTLLQIIKYYEECFILKHREMHLEKHLRLHAEKIWNILMKHYYVCNSVLRLRPAF